MSDGLNIIFNETKSIKSRNYQFNIDQIVLLMEKCVDMIASDFLAK